MKVSLVCKGPVRTNITDPLMKYQDWHRSEPTVNDLSPHHKQRYESFKEWLQSDGMSPADAASIIFDGVRQERLYIYSHPEIKDAVRLRVDNILQECNPDT